MDLLTSIVCSFPPGISTSLNPIQVPLSLQIIYAILTNSARFTNSNFKTSSMFMSVYIIYYQITCPLKPSQVEQLMGTLITTKKQGCTWPGNEPDSSSALPEGQCNFTQPL